jgi:hypothetical protein
MKSGKYFVRELRPAVPLGLDKEQFLQLVNEQRETSRLDIQSMTSDFASAVDGVTLNVPSVGEDPLILADSSELHTRSMWLKSEGMPRNKAMSLADYKSSRGIMVNWGHLLSYYSEIPLNERIYKFDDITNPDLGWKLHLNVSPENVDPVSEFLADNGFVYKYLHGGLPSVGKVFTVYCGSNYYANLCANLISVNVGQFLDYPAAVGEVEFAPGIVGRFVGSPYSYDISSCRYGMSLIKNPTLTYGTDIVEKTYDSLVARYNSFFTGSEN